MIKNFSRLECKVSEKESHFYVEVDTPIVVVKEMLFQLQKYVGAVEDQINAQQKKVEAEKEEVPQEELIKEVE